MVASALAEEKEKQAVIRRQGLRDDIAEELADVSVLASMFDVGCHEDM